MDTKHRQLFRMFASKPHAVLPNHTQVLDFEVGSREDTLDIDGVQLYPPTFGPFAEPFYVTQVGPNETLRLRVTGYTFHYNTAETITEAGNELLPMTFRITAIESKPVDPPALTINLLKDVNGRLMIASFQKADKLTDQEECNEWPLFCKWKSILADKIDGVKTSVGKGCHKLKSSVMGHGKTQGQNLPQSQPHMPPQQGHRGHHGKGGHRGQHGHHGHHHEMEMTLPRVFYTVLVPILIGIFAGTMTYLIGMAIGCLVAVIVARVRGQAPYEPIALEDEEEENQPRGEKEVYAELPAYDAPPIYEEAAEKEVVADETPKCDV